MDASVIGQLDALRPLIKKRWEALLRAEPVSSPLASPDNLVYLMDETLNQLSTMLHTRSVKTFLKRNHSVVAPQHDRCSCGINPLLAYYTTGRVALASVIEDQLGVHTADVLLYYHGLAQMDLEALCGICCNRGSETCTHRQQALERARQSALLRR